MGGAERRVLLWGRPVNVNGSARTRKRLEDLKAKWEPRGVVFEDLERVKDREEAIKLLQARSENGPVEALRTSKKTLYALMLIMGSLLWMGSKCFKAHVRPYPRSVVVVLSPTQRRRLPEAPFAWSTRCYEWRSRIRCHQHNQPFESGSLL
jgi:hypothetical protein